MQAFSGIRVVDLTHVLAGPFATYQLALLGAEVIKIENPTQPDQVRETGSDPSYNTALLGTNFLSQGSNKKAITLNLKTPEGREVLRRLLANADVLVENYRAGALDALGFGYDDVIRIKPDIVYCSMTGYGQSGDKREHTAYDMVIQAVSGLMAMTGTPEVTPLKVGTPVVDYATGMMAAFAISAALMARTRTGQPQRVDVSMQDTALMLMSSAISGYTANGRMPSAPSGNDFHTAEGSCFPTADGLLMLAALNQRQVERLWQALDAAEFLTPVPLSERAEQDRRKRTFLTEKLARKSAEEWEALLNRAGVPAGRVRTLPEALAMPHIAERGLLHTHHDPYGNGRDITVPVSAFTMAEGGPAVETPPPRFGQDTDAILTALGYGPAQISALHDTGAV